jgi:hypothetical protein
MASALRHDTLKFAKRLTEAGLPSAAAEAIVEGLSESDLSELATKSDLQASIAGVKVDTVALRSDVRTEIAGVKAEIAALRADIYGRLWAMGLGIVGLTVALIKLLPG